MKLVGSLVVTLLLAEAGAYKLMQRSALRARDFDDFDADDADIEVRNLDTNDLNTYSQTFLNEGSNVQSLNMSHKQAMAQQQEKLVQQELDDNYNFAVPTQSVIQAQNSVSQ